MLIDNFQDDQGERVGSIKCPSCKSIIPVSSEFCPVCSRNIDESDRKEFRVEEKTVLRKVGGLMGGALLFLLLLALAGVLMQSPKPDHDSAVEYESIGMRETEIGEYRIVVSTVRPNGFRLSREALVHTAIKAALDVEDGTDADAVIAVVHVFPVMPMRGHQIAVARYSPSGHGVTGEDDWTWDVTVMDGLLSDEEAGVAAEWLCLCDLYRTTDTVGVAEIDIYGLRTAIAERLSVPEIEISMPDGMIYTYLKR